MSGPRQQSRRYYFALGYLSTLFYFQFLAAGYTHSQAPAAEFRGPEQSPSILLVGGGNVPDNSQGQIELNVQWVLDVIRRNTSETSVRLLYTDGLGEAPDVKVWQAAEDTENPYQPLARVFGANRENGFIFRSHQLPNNLLLTADKESVTDAVTQSWVSNPSSITFIYNGHGSFGGKDLKESALKLWNDERLSVTEFDQILDMKPAETEFRFILTQCYSGAFAELAWNRNGKVCGFMAQSAYFEAEGCSTSVDSYDYRDYTTYFYAAIDGRDRHGNPLPFDADRDKDGVVTFREAHLYTLASALSTDLSRSTSEMYLEKWEPWYLRWQSFTPIPNNEYSGIANEVLKLIGIESQDNLREAALLKQADLFGQRDTLAEEQKKLRAIEEVLQNNLKKKLTLRWPQVFYPRTLAYQTLINTRLADINQLLIQQPDYGNLKDVQNRLLAIADELLQIERSLTQVQKFFRLRKIARLHSALERFGNEQEKRQYQELVACESNGHLQ